MTQTDTVRAGFIPLVDAAPLIVAAELGFAEEEGLHLQLARETSWATLRDRLAVSHLDVAHILAPLPIAGNIGIGPLPLEMQVPMALGTGANSIVLSQELWGATREAGCQADFNALKAIESLSHVVAVRREHQLAPLNLGVVHAFSAHHYGLAYWLAFGGILPGRDVNLVVLPPPLMPAALKRGQIDGFCAGEPWGSVAVADSAGVIVTTNAHIWRNSPEKVLGARRSWAEDNPDVLARLVRAVFKAAQWCDAPENVGALSMLLSRPEFVGEAAQHITSSLRRELTNADCQQLPIDGFLSFAKGAATFPWISHALWFYSQMVRWGQVAHSPEALEKARGTYRPDLYRSAVSPLGVDTPSANAKVEGTLGEATAVGSASGDLTIGPDTFFDGRPFDPDCLEDYLSDLS